MADTSTKPYLLRALYEWCTDNGYTPYIVVVVDATTRVPMEFVKNGEIVLNISFDATGNLKIDNEYVLFKARFGGVSREIEVPVNNVSAIYARENGQGMSFEVKSLSDAERKKRQGLSESKSGPVKGTPALSAVPSQEQDISGHAKTDQEGSDPEPPKPGGRPTLTRIK